MAFRQRARWLQTVECSRSYRRQRRLSTSVLIDLLAVFPADVWSGLPDDILDQIDAYLDIDEQSLLQT